VFESDVVCGGRPVLRGPGRRKSVLRGTLVLACALALTGSLPALARATTYYVSPSGSDANTGTSTATPWQTVAKVNGAALSPGDSVLFQGGQHFHDAPLTPARSGSTSAPIAFGAYGGGRPTFSRGIALSGVADVAFSGLRLTAGVRGSASEVTLSDNVIALAKGNVVNGIRASGSGWTIAANTVTGAGSSGISLTGSGDTVTNNWILDTGADTAITTPKSAITLDAADTTVSGNVIENFWDNGILVAAHGSTVTRNDITNTRGYTSAASTIGLLFRQNDATAATSTFRLNTIAGTTGSDIRMSAGTFPLTESFVIARNSLLHFSGAYLSAAPTAGSCECAAASNLELGISSGTTYYVASGGSDGNAGTTPSAPWKTIGEVNNPGSNHPGVAIRPGDVVLLRSSQRFSDATLDARSGTTVGGTPEPVVFGSYGAGQAIIAPTAAGDGVWLAGIHNAVVQDLEFDGSSSSAPDGGVYSHDGATDCSDAVCSYAITIAGNTIRHWFEGVRTGPADHDWTVAYNEIDHTDDNGIFFDRSGSGPYFGSTRMDALFNDISDTGQHPPDHPHAIYDDSTSSRVIGNRIARFGDGVIPSSGISIRFTRSIVEGNTIDGGAIRYGNGIDLYDYDTGAGCTAAHPCPSLWAYNRISNVAGNGIYLDYHYGPDACATCLPPQAFTIVNNTIMVAQDTSGSAASPLAQLDFEYPNGTLTLANNIATGNAGIELGLEEDHTPCPIGTTVTIAESHDDWFDTAPGQFERCNARYATLAAYQQGSSLGAQDIGSAPEVDPATFALAPGSPAIDAGTTGIPGAPAYAPTCAGTMFSYCGSAPDLGAVEFRPSAPAVAGPRAARRDRSR
jgi:hypothetical protein